MQTLLRYPGGKSRAVKTITKYLPQGLDILVSPFFGGGSIELYMASQGIRVYGYDIFDPLVCFWQAAINNPKILAEKVNEYYPLPKDRFYHLQNIQLEIQDPIEKAAIFYVLNRCSFLGSTLSGGMSPSHPRFTHSSIERLRNFKPRNISVELADFKNSIAIHKNDFLYLDPPYMIDNFLYGYKGDTHKGFDHSGLFEMLNERKGWVLSYNDCGEVRQLYKDYKIVDLSWTYGMSKQKHKGELLIISD